MAQITGGLVSVEDGKKAAEEYAPARKVRVDLSFTVAEGENFETVFDMASQAASNRVSALLNGTALRVVQPAQEVGQTAGEAPAETKTRTRRTKAQIAADEAAAAAAKAGSTGEPGGAQTSDDPFAEGGAEAGAAEGASEFDVPAEEEGGDEWDVPAEEPAGEPVSDAELNDQVQKKNAELQNPKLIRDLIAQYNPEPGKPFQLRQIPADKRHEFLGKLKALKAAA